MAAEPLRLSSRVAVEAPNELAVARQAAQSSGKIIWDLTDSNPTRHGLMDPGVMTAVVRHLDEASHYAPDPKGWRPAREALAGRFGGRPDDYWLTGSTSEAYSWLFTILAEPAQAVGMPVPGYPLVEPLARLAGLQTLAYPAFYVHPHGWELNLDVARNVAERARAMVVVNPNNPTGAYVNPATAAALGETCASAGVPLIADEVFFPFWLGGDDSTPPRRLADTAGKDAVVITLDGLSKLLAAPQLKVSWLRLSGPPELTAPLAEALDTVADTYLSVNSLAACALPELLTLADLTVARIRVRCIANLAALQGLGDEYRVRRTEGGWTALVDLPRLMDDDELGQRLLQNGLSAHPGWFYDFASGGAIAVSLLPEPPVFADSLRRLARALG